MHYKIAAFFHLQPPKGTPTPKWIARRSLNSLPLNDSACPFFQAVINRKLPQYYLIDLLEYKSRGDDLPNGLVRATDPRCHKLKCTAHSILGIKSAFAALLRERLINDPSVAGAIESYRTYDFNAFKGSHKLMTTSSEILFINETLDLVIGYLKREYKLQ
ncbi:MAG: hypothetical protein NTX79_00855 [Candidatus Micrarchaeota archaeon]|nr:hypothetical protein [Candidatus Micrarchaeota archaeon]